MTNKILTKQDLQLCIYAVDKLGRIKHKVTLERLGRMLGASDDEPQKKTSEEIIAESNKKRSYEKDDWDEKDEF